MFVSLAYVALVLSLLVSSTIAQYTTSWGICFTNTNKPGSPYGPWSVATSALLQVGAPFYFNDPVGTPASAGGLRWAQNVTSATGSRTQLNRDGTTSTATLTLGTKGVQGSDLLFFNNTPYTDWNGIVFQVVTSSDQPYPGSTSWIVYPNDFPTQQVELYYDLPVLKYPSEYHTDNSTNGNITIQAGGVVPNCVPAPITTALQPSALTYQFCYQAYSTSSTPAWQVAISGTFLTQPAYSTSTISGQCGLYILSVTGTRTQQIGTNASTSVNIVGQTFHNSGTTIVDKNEYNDDPLLQPSSPFLVPNYGFVFYTDNQFTYPSGVAETINNAYAKVDADPLAVSGSSVTEQQGPTPTFSNFAVSCGCSGTLTCPLITSSSAAAVSGSASSSCNAVSQSTSYTTCSTTSSVSSNSSGTCTPSSSNGATKSALSATTLLAATLATSAALLL